MQFIVTDLVVDSFFQISELFKISSSAKVYSGEIS